MLAKYFSFSYGVIVFEYNKSFFMSDNNIAICFAVNESYAKYLGVVITSILVNNKNCNLSFHILTNSFPEKDKKEIDKVVKHFGNAKVFYHAIPLSLFEGFKLSISYISIETYFRYVLSNLLPDLKKIIYLDADIMVNGSLLPYWNTDLTNIYMAGSRDHHIDKMNYLAESEIFDENDVYLNAGSLLFNLGLIRENNMQQKLFDNTIGLQDKIKYQDQDILNYTFKNKIKDIGVKTNFTSLDVKLYPHLRDKAVVVHYTGRKKPWNKNCKNELRWLYKKYSKIMKNILNGKSYDENSPVTFMQFVKKFFVWNV